MGLLFERACPVCGHRARRLCGPCRDLLAHPEEVAPAERPAGLDELVVLAPYDDDVRRIVLGLKADGRRDLARDIARAMAVAVDERGLVVDLITWVPSAPEHRRARGFDQGRLVARALGRRLDVPARRLLERRGGSRRALGADDRRAGIELAAAASPARVLVVDDVVTTGSSLRSAAAALRGAGARRVVAIATSRARHEVFTSTSD